MTIEHEILKDLLAGPSTASSLAGRVKLLDQLDGGDVVAVLLLEIALTDILIVGDVELGGRDVYAGGCGSIPNRAIFS